MKAKRNQRFEEVKAELLRRGWRVHIPPICRAVDDTWEFRLKADRLDFLFVSESDFRWERKRFTREPFGDFTIPYKPKGKGNTAESLLENTGSVGRYPVVMEATMKTEQAKATCRDCGKPLTHEDAAYCYECGKKRFLRLPCSNGALPDKLCTPANQVKLANKFSELLSGLLGPETMAEVRRRNLNETLPQVCHSHDFLDANVVMHEAGKALGFWTEDVDVQDPDICALWSGAWEIAVNEEFAEASIAEGNV